MVKNGNGCKTLEIPWWLQLSKRQILTFLPRLSFGTVRSEVRILSPRPINFKSHKQLRLTRVVSRFSLCGQLWTKFFDFTKLTTFSFVTIFKNRLKTRK